MRRLRQALRALPGYRGVRNFLIPPHYQGAKLTWKRLLNLYVLRYQYLRGHTKLWSYPSVLTLEAANVCNLQCPGCFTGVGEVGRERSFMPLDLYRRLLGEMGDYLLQIEFYNWGEPLLHKEIHTMISEANERGIGTIISTNFSIRFDAERAERLVASGLAVLGVSLDGAEQESYEQYRVGGNLELVLQNCRLVNDAKKKLGSATPRMVWEFHVFPHNVDDIARARSMAKELEMDIGVTKGWVGGAEWDPDGEFQHPKVPMGRCVALWDRGVVYNDGGVAPCCGTFYQQDDMGRMKMNERGIGKRTFKEVWNDWSYLEARRLYRSRTGSRSTKSLVCFDCPATKTWENYKGHLAAGGDADAFESGYSVNDYFNYFFNRRHDGSAGRAGGDVIELQAVDSKPGRST